MSKPATRDRPNGLRVIAVLKFAKALLFLTVGFGIFRVVNEDVAQLARQWASHLRIDPENYFLRQLLGKLTDINPQTLRKVGLLSFLFSADLMVEAVGLWYNQAWAKYLVAIATTVFLPEEINALIHGFSWEKILIFCLNLSVAAYLVWIILEHRRQEKKDRETQTPAS